MLAATLFFANFYIISMRYSLPKSILVNMLRSINYIFLYPYPSAKEKEYSDLGFQH